MEIELFFSSGVHWYVAVSTPGRIPICCLLYLDYERSAFCIVLYFTCTEQVRAESMDHFQFEDGAKALCVRIAGR